jgi:hypothetical protein
MTKAPPDFTKLFFDPLGGVVAPIRYPLRDGPCLLHDVAFLSSGFDLRSNTAEGGCAT